MLCTKCGKENENGAAFCGFCGAPLGAAALAPAPKGKKRWVLPLCGIAAVAVVLAAVWLFVKPGGAVPVSGSGGRRRGLRAESIRRNFGVGNGGAGRLCLFVSGKRKAGVRPERGFFRRMVRQE